MIKKDKVARHHCDICGDVILDYCEWTKCFYCKKDLCENCKVRVTCERKVKDPTRYGGMPFFAFLCEEHLPGNSESYFSPGDGV
ncbi:hypothetical protein LCGC14_3058050 [marine sediment metagenome]|uniref:Uncharacterized protein n=1 Tax=marine sediment metagenome TaxID=412755 RepID=A0A0F8ZAI6_9ZZZZ